MEFKEDRLFGTMCTWIFITVTSIFLVQFVGAVTDSDVEECGTDLFGHITCRSVNIFYRECIVPGATSVEAIKLYRNYSSALCDFKSTFGFRDNVIWITEGCSGEFLVCYRGVRVSTFPQTGGPNPTVGPRPVTTPAGGDPGVARGSNTEPDTNKASLYIGITLGILALLAAGVVVAFIIKRRQTREKARILVERRQKTLDISRPHVGDDAPVPVSSVEQQEDFGIARHDRTGSERAFHTLAARFRESSTGGLNRTTATGKFATSGKVAGRITRPSRSSIRRLSLALDGSKDFRRYRSDPDVNRLGRAPSDPTLFKSASSYCSSHSSLGSITEEIPLDDVNPVPDIDACALNKKTARVKPISSSCHFATPCYRTDKGSRGLNKSVPSQKIFRDIDSVSQRSRSPSELSVFSQYSASSEPRRVRTKSSAHGSRRHNEQSHDPGQPLVFIPGSATDRSGPSSQPFSYIHGNRHTEQLPNTGGSEQVQLVYHMPETSDMLRPTGSDYSRAQFSSASSNPVDFYAVPANEDEATVDYRGRYGEYHEAEEYFGGAERRSSENESEAINNFRPISPVVVVSSPEVIYSQVRKPRGKSRSPLPHYATTSRSSLKTRPGTRIGSPVERMGTGFDVSTRKKFILPTFSGIDLDKFSGREDSDSDFFEQVERTSRDQRHRLHYAMTLDDSQL